MKQVRVLKGENPRSESIQTVTGEEQRTSHRYVSTGAEQGC